MHGEQGAVAPVAPEPEPEAEVEPEPEPELESEEPGTRGGTSPLAGRSELPTTKRPIFVRSMASERAWRKARLSVGATVSGKTSAFSPAVGRMRELGR